MNSLANIRIETVGDIEMNLGESFHPDIELTSVI